MFCLLTHTSLLSSVAESNWNARRFTSSRMSRTHVFPRRAVLAARCVLFSVLSGSLPKECAALRSQNTPRRSRHETPRQDKHAVDRQHSAGGGCSGTAIVRCVVNVNGQCEQKLRANATLNATPAPPPPSVRCFAPPSPGRT